MKTLVIISHPDIIDSSSQQFLINAMTDSDDITIHHLEGTYPDGHIDIAKEHALLQEHDRIIFQFPFYWYSSPAMLKQWQDDVLTDGFAIGKSCNALYGKEFGLVFVVGIREQEYQAGGRELFSISELMRPFQALAHKTGMTYIKPMPIFQFSYMTDAERLDLVVTYLQMLTAEKDLSLIAKEKWLLDQLQKTNKNTLQEKDVPILEHAIDRVRENREKIDELKLVLDDMY